jgi:hypothetical protein
MTLCEHFKINLWPDTGLRLLGSGFRRHTVTITAGEPEFHCWCAVCGTPTRVRVPLHVGSTANPAASVLEICPGCGTGYDRPSVAVTAAPRERLGHPLARLARTVHGWACRRRGRRSLACAYADCQWPGLYRHERAIVADDGTWRYVFCRRSHQRAWASENRLLTSA